MSLTYYIASRGRPHCYSFHALPKEIQARAFIVVRPDEKDLYVEQGGFKPHRLLVLDKGVEGLSATRQWVQDNADKRYIVQLDDDLKGYTKKIKPEEFASMHPMTYRDILKMDALFFRWLRAGRIGHCGMGDRMQTAWAGKEYAENTQIARFFCHDRIAVKSAGARWDRIPLIQDKDITLQLLRAGVPNRVSLMHCYNETGMGRNKGGVGIYRTSKLYEDCVVKLAKLHPGIVTVVDKARDHGSFQCTIQPRVAWSKAFNYDKRRKP